MAELKKEKRDSSYSGNNKYKKKMDVDVIQLYNGGLSDAEVAVELNISRQTFYKWVKTKPSFAEGVEKGRSLSEAWWQRIGRLAVMGKLKVNARIYIANMKNRFQWIETVVVDRTGDNDKDLLEVMAPLLEKYERKY